MSLTISVPVNTFPAVTAAPTLGGVREAKPIGPHLSDRNSLDYEADFATIAGKYNVLSNISRFDANSSAAAKAAMTAGSRSLKKEVGG